MFTGIVKAIGAVRAVQKKAGDLRFSITAPAIDWESLEVGESIAVNGVCLTAVSYVENGFETDVSLETIEVTALSDLLVGSNVNLETSLSLGDRLGGHLVSGHVDCVGIIKARELDARSVRLVIEIPQAYRRYVARKGSVCIDGVSLTVNAVSARTFDVNIIPHTASTTIVGDYKIGTRVNIEVDLLARYLERLLECDEDSPLSRDFLREHGYV